MRDRRCAPGRTDCSQRDQVVKAEESVHSHQQAQRLLRTELGAQLQQRVDGVARALAAAFAVVDHEARVARASQLRPSPAGAAAVTRGVARWGGMLAGMRRTWMQRQRIGQLFGQAQMRVVDRVEGAAEDADGSEAKERSE